jgi:DNA-binding NarL/FixJ family response regulator
VLLVATERPPVFAFFASLGAPARRVDVAAEAARQAATTATAALVDFGLDSAAAMAVVDAVRHDREGLPIAALVCCAHSVTPQGVRALAAAGVGSLLDLQMNRDEAIRALREVASGAAVLHLSFGGRSHATLHDVVSGHRLRREDDVRLLELVAQGLPDREIGELLHLSPHTVKKRVEHLRAEVGARNRIELAAWAGRQGLYAGATRTA